MNSLRLNLRIRWKAEKKTFQLSYLLLFSSLLFACSTNSASPQTGTQKTPTPQISTHQVGVLYVGYMLYQKPYNPYPTTAQSATIVIAALHADSGQKIWQNTYPPQDLAHYAYTINLLVANTVIYAVISTGISGQVIALDARTGHVLWKYTENVGIIATPIAANGNFYMQLDQITVGSKTLQALDGKSGKLLWSVSTGDYTIWQFAVTDQAVYVVQTRFDDEVQVEYDSEIVRALRLSNGATLWQKEFHNTPISSSGPTSLGPLELRADDQAVYLFKMEWKVDYLSSGAIKDTNTLLALHTGDGSPVWSVQDLHDYSQGNINLTLDEHILYLMNGEHMSMFNSQDGKPLGTYISSYGLWKLLPEGHLFGTGQSKEENFCALKLSDGTRLWCSSFFMTIIAIGTENVYLTNEEDGVQQEAIYIFRQSDGTQIGHYTVADPTRVFFQNMVFAEENL